MSNLGGGDSPAGPPTGFAPERLDYIDPKQSCWEQSLFRRMGFVRRLGTTGKIPIPDSLKKELEKSYLHGIVKKI